MHMHVWVVVGMMLAAVYVLPIAVGLFVSSLRTAVMLAVASFCGLYATRLVGIAAAVGASGERSDLNPNSSRF